MSMNSNSTLKLEAHDQAILFDLRSKDRESGSQGVLEHVIDSVFSELIADSTDQETLLYTKQFVSSMRLAGMRDTSIGSILGLSKGTLSNVDHPTPAEIRRYRLFEKKPGLMHRYRALVLNPMLITRSMLESFAVYAFESTLTREEVRITFNRDTELGTKVINIMGHSTSPEVMVARKIHKDTRFWSPNAPSVSETT